MTRFTLLLAIGTLCMAAPAAAQVLRVEDESGVVHYTNNPCAPLYRRLAPGACPSAPPEPAAAEGQTTAVHALEIESAARRYGVDRRLVEAMVRVESGGNPRAISPKGALGLMQLMPARAAELGVTNAFDPRANLDGGVRHLRALIARYDGDLTLALAAYNAGDEAVRLYRGVPPYPETQEYVRKVLALYAPRPAVPSRPPTRRPISPKL